MRWKRAGQSEAAPLEARAPIDVSERTTAQPSRLGVIRGIAEVVIARMQTPDAWRELWADED